MNPKEREELLREARQSDRKADRSGEQTVVDRVELTQGETLEDRLDWAAERAAMAEPIQTVRDILAINIKAVRDALDPRVILEAEDLGCGREEIEAMRSRMEQWAEAVKEKRDGESPKQREIRLEELINKIFVDTSFGCGCEGSGFRPRVGDFRRRDGKRIPGTPFMECCDCDMGKARAVFLRKPRGGRRRRKKDDSLDEVMGQ